LRPDAITIAEDVSGLPGLAAPAEDGGLGFDYKLAMGIPDYWFKLLKEVKDEDWNVEEMMRELTNRRNDEKTISYVECHDQSIVGGKTLIFELIDADMYFAMSKKDENLRVDRGIALHKMIRLATIATAGQGYLTFIGNEFGHPEWVDFPREGNGWSYKYARRQWSLVDNPDLKYHFLGDFEKEFLHLFSSKQLLENNQWAEMPFVNTGDQVIAIRRGPVIFIFNFNPFKSFSDYPVDLPEGSYKLLFNSDEERFGGMNRVLDNQIFSTEDVYGRTCIKIYIPARSCLVIS
jgi:1,4-alpha-glucan branching enzyme